MNMLHTDKCKNRLLKLNLQICKTTFLYLLFFPNIVISGQNGRVQYNPVLPISSQRFCFAVLGDRTGSGPDSWTIMDRAIDELNELRPDFIVFIGDIIEGQTQSYQAIIEQWNEADTHFSRVRAPLFMVPGNHDIWDRQSCKIWEKRVGHPYFSFNHKGCHFLIVNTEDMAAAEPSGLGNEQMEFILRDISRNRQTSHLYIFLHKPIWLYPGKLKTQWNQIEKNLEGLNYTVVAGHIHLSAASLIKGKRFFISGPTGGRMRFPRNTQMGLFHHYSWFTVDKDTTTIALIEPGSLVKEEVARKAYQRYVQGLFLLKGKDW